MKLKKYDKLSEGQKQAVWEYMITPGGVDVSEYDDWVRRFGYCIRTVKASTLRRLFDKKGWHWRWEEMGFEKQRITTIKRRHRRGLPVWPYIVGGGKNLKEWAADEMNHGDGWHRLCLAIQEDRTIEFLYLKTVKKLPVLHGREPLHGPK